MTTTAIAMRRDPERRGASRVISALMSPTTPRHCGCYLIAGEACRWAPRPCLRSPSFLEDAAANVVAQHREHPWPARAALAVEPELALPRHVIQVRAVLTATSLMPEQRAAVVELGLHLLGVAHSLGTAASIVGPAIMSRPWGFVTGQSSPKKFRGVGIDISEAAVRATAQDLALLVGARADHCRRAWRRVMHSCACVPDAALLGSACAVLGTAGTTGWRCCCCHRLHGNGDVVCLTESCAHIRGSTSFYGGRHEPALFPAETVTRSTASCCYGRARPCDFCTGKRCRGCGLATPCGRRGRACKETP